MNHPGYLSSTPFPGNVFRQRRMHLASEDNYDSICV